MIIIFGDKKEDLGQILYDFCIKYYNIEMFDILLSHSNNLLNYLKKEVTLELDCARHKNAIDIPKLIEILMCEYFNIEREPNGVNKFPDGIIKKIAGFKNVYIDAKAVLVKNGKETYNNACQNIARLTDDIIEHYNGQHNNFYLSFIIYAYYDEDGNVYDVLITPMIYSIELKKFSWKNLSSIQFRTKGNYNDNVCLGLPSLRRNIEIMSLDEKELLLGTAAHNYNIKHNANETT